MLHHPLLPYQREGMLHLAFGERALLADEMGLGKTVQAIAACELLARRKGIARVLVVCPASLKAEWEEQIARFTERPRALVFGARPARLAAYREPPFFTIVNYEQVLIDAADINEMLRPDVVVLDEAQRIKNWQTKTARRVKSLRAPYAFVLTGTPIENRIDELYSIVQYLDPELVGPLFRFNRDFYALDERGRPIDYKNLAELRRRLAPVMLRRRKADVEIRAARPHGEELFRADGRGAEAALRRLPRAGRHAHRQGAATAAAAGGVRPPADAARLHAHDLRHAGDPRPDLPDQPQARGAGRNPGRPAGGAGPQDHRVLGVGAHAGAGARARRRDGRGGGLAHRLGAAAAPSRRDHALQAGPGLPAVPLHRQRQRRASTCRSRARW